MIRDPSRSTSLTRSLAVVMLLAGLSLTRPLAAERQSAAPDGANTDALSAGFANPPSDARPRVWWHWMNGNITKDGIAKDLEWMHRIGIGGAQTFDAALDTPQVVDHRLAYMTPEWRDAFRFAAATADRLGLELATAASPGWSETGGPWVQPKDGMKKLVWSETAVASGRRFAGTLALPPGTTGPFQDVKVNDPLATKSDTPRTEPAFYADVRVLAYRVAADRGLSAPVLSDASGVRLDQALLRDGRFDRSVAVGRGTAARPGYVAIDYATPQTIRSASLAVENVASLFAGAPIVPELQVQEEDGGWRDVARLPVDFAAQTTASFAPVTARHFRVLLTPSNEVAALSGSPAPGAVVLDMFPGRNAPDVRISELRLGGSPSIDRFEVKAGFGIEPDYYGLGRVADGTTGPSPGSVIDLTSRMRADGHLNWIPPKGHWRILRLGYSLTGTTNHPATAEATGLEVDKYDGAAVAAYLTTYLDKVQGAAGPDLFGARGLHALVTDSIEVGPSNWTPDMIAQFRRLRGYDPTPWLPTLTGAIIGTRSDSDRFLYDYRRTLADLIASQHYGTIAEVAHRRGLTVYGEALEVNRPSLGDDLAMRAYVDVPMAALWTYGPTGPAASGIADMRGAASIAHLLGRNHVAAESMTSAFAPWAYAPADLKRFVDLEFVSGINRPVIHTSVHQPVDNKVPGLSLLVFGQFFNRHETWAEMAKPWIDYMARTSFMLAQGRNVADVAYFYGEEASPTALFGKVGPTDSPTANGYDYLDAATLMAAIGVQDGRITSSGGASYRLIYLGGRSTRMTLPTLRKLASLVEAGATVAGKPPIESPSLADDPAAFAALVRRLWTGGPVTPIGQGRILAVDTADAALSAMGTPPDVSVQGLPVGAILFLHRHLPEGELYFVSNRSGRAGRFDVRFGVAGRSPELWQADSGTVEPLSYSSAPGVTAVPLDLAADGAALVLFRARQTAPSRVVTPPASRVVVPLDTGWTATFQAGRGAPLGILPIALGSLALNADPAIRYFSGTTTYRTVINATRPQAGERVSLDLGQVGDVAEVVVNGVSAGIAWRVPYRVDVSRVLKPGRNHVEVRVANLWVNRLIGDAQPGAEKIAYTTIPTYKADAPVRPSGLIGPVRLIATIAGPR